MVFTVPTGPFGEVASTGIKETNVVPADGVECMNMPIDISAAPASVPEIVASREAAVSRVFKGSALALLGITMGLGADLANVAMSSVLLLGGGLAAAGLSMIGRAARHLWRYGGRLEASLLTAFGGLGAGVLSSTVGESLLTLGVLELPGQVLTAVGIVGTLLFAGAASVLLLWALLRWG